jgi:hypothetical protein
MATTTYKVLAQSAPAATTNTDVYTVPASTSAVVSTVTVCNRAASAGTFRIAVRPAGAAIANQHYIAYDVAIAANDSTNLTLGITLATTDIVTVYCSSANMSVSIFGSQIS